VDFAFSDEQDMLRTSARALLAERYPIERVASIADGAGFDRREWSAIVDVGWTAISVPEDEGGAGLGFLEEMLIAEETGRALYPGPFLSSIVMALPALRIAGDGVKDLAADVATGRRIATVAWAGRDGRIDVERPPPLRVEDGRLVGDRSFVPDLAAADLVLVVGAADGSEAPAIWALDLDAGGVRRSGLATVDGTRPLADLALSGAEARMVASGAAAAGILRRVRDRALVASAAEACGVAGRALELAVAHARERKQFGRPVGSFQAVSHELARAFQDVESSRSLTYWAAWAVDQGEPDAPAAAAAARARAADAAVATCERAIQVHGGIGFTWEHPLHRFYKRALGISATMGSADELWSRVADEVLATV
jgi:alkylation response protein AidB-like acyl-CoA dehydrogenase